MKIKTEIFQSIYIITCEGSSLNPSPVEVFLSAMTTLIQKNHLDILLDLSDVEVVEGAKLGAIARSLEAIEGHGLLLICGVNERDFNLLKMTHLDEKFLQATNRNEALATLYWEKKKAPGAVPPEKHEPPAAKEEPVTPPGDVTKKEGEEGDRESIYEIEHDDIEIVVSSDRPEVENWGRKLVFKEMGGEDDPFEGIEGRRYKRIKSRQIMDEEFIVFCKNITTGKHYTAVVSDISLGGLFMKLSPPRISVGEELTLKGRIGKNYRFRERAVCHSRRQEGKFVFEFIDLSDETTQFLNLLTGALG